VPRLKNALMEMMMMALPGDNSIPTFGMVIYFFEHLPESDALPRFLVDMLCLHGGVTRLDTNSVMLAPQLPQPFLVRVLLRLNEISKMGENVKRLKRGNYVIKD
jgi:hypothetical protein